MTHIIRFMQEETQNFYSYGTIKLRDLIAITNQGLSTQVLKDLL